MACDQAWIFEGMPALIDFEDLMTLILVPSDAVREAYLKLTGKVRHKVSTFG
jgi:hypothetical protein